MAVSRKSVRAKTILLCAVWTAWVSVLFGCTGSVTGDGSSRADSGAPEAGDGSSRADSGAPEAGDGITLPADAGPGASACEHYYAAQYSRCGGPALPSGEAQRAEARFVKVCLNEIALPGSGMTLASIEACASALDSSPCEFPGGGPLECNFHGGLPGGAPCNEGMQCQSGQCRGTAFLSPEGQIGPSTCGTCEPFVALGQVCGHGNFSGGCASDAICLLGPGMATAAQPTYTCVAVTQGDVGATCDDLSATCKAGLYCEAKTGTCSKLGGAGALCAEGATPPGNAGGCAAPLACIGTPGACNSSSAGGFCTYDPDCTPGLGCVPGPPCSSGTLCAASGTCAPVAWAAPGQACDGFRTRCLVGQCSSGSFLPPLPTPDGGIGSGKCPAVALDGQPCGAACDTFAECFDPTASPGMTTSAVGTCRLLDSVVCK